MEKKDYKELMDTLEPKLSRLQRACTEAGIPVMILFEGLDGAGKGHLINQLIQSLDPRGFQVAGFEKATDEEKCHPYLWRFYNHLPSDGKIAIFDRGWYTKVQLSRFHKKLNTEETQNAYFEINTLEKQLTDAGYVIIKFFLIIDKEEQRKRFLKLEESKETRWRVTARDWKRNKKYDRFLKISEEMLEQTESPHCSWTVVPSTDFYYAFAQIALRVTAAMEQALLQKQGKKKGKPGRPKSSVILKRVRSTPLSQADLSLSLDQETYKEHLKPLQQRLSRLHNEIYQKRIPVVLVFEGWDAGGKGGAIKRLTQCLDPRGYQVHPVSAPTAAEKSYHYLHRFWINMPKSGHISIFDRSWYGRVMVERIEGFCKPDEWKRAYGEINDMEKILTDQGCVILKFWMHIDRDEQLTRFHERQNDPEKQWKITDEDWRNREKWDQYEEAVNEMLIRTSTSYAPWIIVEGNCKYYARIKVLQTVVDALEERLKEK